MTDISGVKPNTNHRDAWPDVAARIAINEEFATAPPEVASMYAQGFEKAKRYIALGETALVLDVGCANLVPAARGAKLARMEAHIIGVDIDDESFNLYPPPPDANVSFRQADAQELPFGDDMFDLTTAHNTIFRVRSPSEMLAELVRVTKPGGIIEVSTNAPNHALHRHRFERDIAERVIKEFELDIEPPKAPAHTSYLKKLQNMVKGMRGLALLETYVQQDWSVITEDRIGVFQFAIDGSVIRLPGATPEMCRRWRELVEEMVLPKIKAGMKQPRGSDEPYFADRIHRGLVILRKEAA